MSITRTGKQSKPLILVFSTDTISDMGIDLAGSSHKDYSPRAVTISIPCSSGLNPQWVLDALNNGFDGVFIAADGSDCAFVSDCTERTSKVVEKTQELMKKNGYSLKRLKMAAVCSVCAESFVDHIFKFSEALMKLQQSSEEKKLEPLNGL
ncbi:MAG: hydrogenase iron-sulfur subunit [Caldisericia bacterium]|nr:hydrogenase iron-sulfur subunit [Caldisericia bacterium]